jgi:hypothetical protein
VSFVYFLFGGKFGRRAKKRHETHSIDTDRHFIVYARDFDLKWPLLFLATKSNVKRLAKNFYTTTIHHTL